MDAATRKALLEKLNASKERTSGVRAANEAKKVARRAKEAKQAQLQGKAPSGSIKALHAVWQKLMAEHYPDYKHDPPWWIRDDSGNSKPDKPTGLVKRLIARYGVEFTERLLTYCVAHWSEVQGKFAKAPLVPNVGFITGYSDSLAPEAEKEHTSSGAVKEMEQWYLEHPGEPPPDDLMERFRAASKKGVG